MGAQPGLTCGIGGRVLLCKKASFSACAVKPGLPGSAATSVRDGERRQPERQFSRLEPPEALSSPGRMLETPASSLLDLLRSLSIPAHTLWRTPWSTATRPRPGSHRRASPWAIPLYFLWASRPPSRHLGVPSSDPVCAALGNVEGQRPLAICRGAFAQSSLRSCFSRSLRATLASFGCVAAPS